MSAMNAIDIAVLQWLYDHRTPEMTAFMQVWSDLNGNWAMLAWAALFAGYLLWRRRRDWALTVAVAIPGIELINALAKILVKRPRPAFDDAIVHLETFSFPSGHVAVSTVLYSLLAAYIIANTRSAGVRVASVLAAFALVALVGSSRMYLGAHYPTDVLGAIVEGLLWVAVCLSWRSRAHGADPISR
jgi:membrane-associated phospholipid phosphatase